MAKTFDEYQAEHLKEPFPLPMPQGAPVLIQRATIDSDRAVRRAVAAAGDDANQFTGLELVVGEADAARVAAAWGKLPPDAWRSAMKDMREHFGEGNEEASPPS